MQSIYAPPTIQGVVSKNLNPIVDDRGNIIELWSKPWVKSSGYYLPRHIYQSATDPGVVKAWHLHKIHTDQIAVFSGKVQLVLVDIRPKSKTFCHVNSIFMGIQSPKLVKVPPGIVHGWKVLSQDSVSILNFQTHLYDSKDELKFPWDCMLSDVWGPKNG